MRRAAISLLCVIIAFDFTSVAGQGINIPGLGRIRIPVPRLPPVLRGRTARPGRAAPVATIQPATNPDGSARCGASIDLPGFARLRIVEARFTDRPPLTGFQGVAAGGIRGFWVIDYEATAYVDRAYGFSVSFMGSRAQDSNGGAWGSMRAPQAESRGLTPAGEAVRGQVIYISYESNGSGIATMSPRLAASVTAPGQRVLDGYNRGANLDFPPIPANCTDRPLAGAARVAAGRPVTGLIRPRQILREGVASLNARGGTVREAVQIGFIWSYGEGVHPDFEQGLAWYREAERRQGLRHDLSMQNEIRLMLANYAETDVERLFNRGIAALARNGWQESLYFFGRAAELGNAQAMAALGYVYGEGRLNPRMQFFWCRRSFLAARASRREHDLDAVNHFCPVITFADVMTARERAANPASIARARAKSGAIRREHDAMAALARQWWREAVIEGLTDSSDSGGGGGSGPAADRAYARGQGDRPSPLRSGLYGNCHGGAFYGCPEAR